jgi:hypothetical protein
VNGMMLAQTHSRGRAPCHRRALLLQPNVIFRSVGSASLAPRRLAGGSRLVCERPAAALVKSAGACCTFHEHALICAASTRPGNCVLVYACFLDRERATACCLLTLLTGGMLACVPVTATRGVMHRRDLCRMHLVACMPYLRKRRFGLQTCRCVIAGAACKYTREQTPNPLSCVGEQSVSTLLSTEGWHCAAWCIKCAKVAVALAHSTTPAGKNRLRWARRTPPGMGQSARST